MRRAGVAVPVVVICRRWVIACKWIHPRAGPDAGLARIQTGAVRIGAPRAQIGAGSAPAGVTSKVAGVAFQRQESVF